MNANTSGAALNPAIGFALTLYNSVNFDWSGQMIKGMFVYVFGPLFGGVVAAIFHRSHLKTFKVMNLGAPKVQKYMID